MESRSAALGLAEGGQPEPLRNNILKANFKSSSAAKGLAEGMA